MMVFYKKRIRKWVFLFIKNFNARRVKSKIMVLFL